MRFFQMGLMALVLASLGGCEVIGGIFKAGMWVGIIFVVAIIALVAFVASKFRR